MLLPAIAIVITDNKSGHNLPNSGREKPVAGESWLSQQNKSTGSML